MSMDCAHDDLEITADVVQVEPDTGSGFLSVKQRIRCSTCYRQFHFRGIASGHPNPNEPTVSADGFELRCPIMAGPGAVVGLLERTGLTKQLVQPDGSDGD